MFRKSYGKCLQERAKGKYYGKSTTPPPKEFNRRPVLNPGNPLVFISPDLAGIPAISGGRGGVG